MELIALLSPQERAAIFAGLDPENLQWDWDAMGSP
jgi:hypothetical protein